MQLLQGYTFIEIFFCRRIPANCSWVLFLTQQNLANSTTHSVGIQNIQVSSQVAISNNITLITSLKYYAASSQLLFIQLKRLPFAEGIWTRDPFHLLLVLLVLVCGSAVSHVQLFVALKTAACQVRVQAPFSHETAIYQDHIHLAVYRIVLTNLCLHVFLKVLFRIVSINN